jgi:hypothetical protein
MQLQCLFVYLVAEQKITQFQMKIIQIKSELKKSVIDGN